MGVRGDLLLDEAAELVADHVQRLVVQPRVAEPVVDQQVGDPPPCGRGVAVGNQPRHRRVGQERRRIGRAHAHIGRAHRFHLAERDPAGHLRQVFAEGRTQDQALQLAQPARRFQAFGPIGHLPQGGRVGGQPGEGMGGELMFVEPRRIRPAVDDHTLGHAVPGNGQQGLDRRHRRLRPGYQVLGRPNDRYPLHIANSHRIPQCVGG